MPRLAKTAIQIRNDNLKAVIVANLVKLHMNKREFIAKCGFTPATFYRKYDNPGCFELDELYRMSNILNISIHTLIGGETS